MVRLKGISLMCVSDGVGVDDRVGEKSMCEAYNGDSYGRRHLFGGVVMALLVLPRLEHQGKTLIRLSDGRQRRSYIVSSLEASPRWFVESSACQ